MHERPDSRTMSFKRSVVNASEKHVGNIDQASVSTKVRRLARFATLIFISACSVGPNYSRPSMATPATYKEADASKSSQPIGEVVRTNWWEIFGDSELNALEQQVEISNQNVAQAEARFRQARALVQSARAAYFPTVTIGVGITREQPSATVSGGPGKETKPFTEHSLPIDVSWELDVWGRIRRTVEANEANAQAGAADLEAAS